MSYTDVFGGNLIFPSRVSYLELETAIDVVLQWPTEQQITGGDVVADVMDVNTTAPALNIDMPDARNTSLGNKATFNNVGGNTFTVRDVTGGTIQDVQPGEQWVIILTDNTTDMGLWTTFLLGGNAATPASASVLAGDGLEADGSQLNQIIDSDEEAATPFTVVTGDRAKCLIYIAGAGTCNLPSAGAVDIGNNWFFMLRNSGSGTLNIVPPSGDIDGASSLNLDPNGSTFIFTDGVDWYTIGLTVASVIAFDFVSLAVPGSGDFVLSGANLDRISYRFTGALTGNRRIVVPNTTQQYWADNQTSGAFSLEVSTVAGAGITVPQGQSVILYSDATDVINATSSTSVAFPITVGQGGTGATTPGGAQINLEVPPEGRLINTGAGLDGGGDLTGDRTLILDINSANVTPTPVVGDFIAFEDIDDNLTYKATIQDIVDLASPGITIEDEGVPLATLADTLDFVGAGVTASGVGSTKTITIPGSDVGASAALGRLLKGDGSGGWVDAGGNIEIGVAGDIKTNNGQSFIASSGADQVELFVGGGTAFLVSSGGTIFHFQTDEIWRFTNGSIFLGERSGGPEAQVGGFGQLWSDGPNVVGTNPNTMHFEDDSGNDYRIDGMQRRATLALDVMNNDDVLANIGNLSNYHIAPARRYKCKATIFWSSTTVADIKFALDYSQTPEETGFAIWTSTSAVSTVETDVELSAFNEINITTMETGTNCVLIEFTFESHATLAGTLALQFAQNTASAVNTTILQPSFFEVSENDNIS
jgi:hypothetical protein